MAASGVCSLEVTVLGPDSKPVYAASVKVHIAYGFGGFHKLDLEVGTTPMAKPSSPDSRRACASLHWNSRPRKTTSRERSTTILRPNA
jgi:hypothetical protein